LVNSDVFLVFTTWWFVGKSTQPWIFFHEQGPLKADDMITIYDLIIYNYICKHVKAKTRIEMFWKQVIKDILKNIFKIFWKIFSRYFEKIFWKQVFKDILKAIFGQIILFTDSNTHTTLYNQCFCFYVQNVLFWSTF